MMQVVSFVFDSGSVTADGSVVVVKRSTDPVRFHPLVGRHPSPRGQPHHLPQASTNAPGGFVFPAAEALIAIGPAIGDCFERLKATKPLSVEETLWLRISHELYPEGLEYELYCAAQTNDLRAARLMQSLPWHRLTEEDMKEP